MTQSSLQVGNIVHVGVPQITDYTGKFITLSPVNPQTHVVELCECSHGSEMKEQLWTYMSYGPFKNKYSMQNGLRIVRSQMIQFSLQFIILNRSNE